MPLPSAAQTESITAATMSERYDIYDVDDRVRSDRPRRGLVLDGVLAPEVGAVA